MEKLITPDFLIVGAPKCGTTALNDFLSQHPQINLIKKEQHFFGKDLSIKNNKQSEESYFNQFTSGKINGDASVWYLYSDSIFEELKAINAQPKIIIMLRNPVDFIYSLHSQNLFDANEDERDFETALELEISRSEGINIPPKNNIKKSLAYREVAFFYKRIEAYLRHIPKDRVFFGLQEDLKQKPKEFLTEVETFLNLEKFGNYDFGTINANKEIKNLALHQTIKSPNKFKKSIIRTLIPSKKLREKIAKRVYDSNFEESSRHRMSNSLRNQLLDEFSDSISKLSFLIKKDLSQWKEKSQ